MCWAVRCRRSTIRGPAQLNIEAADRRAAQEQGARNSFFSSATTPLEGQTTAHYLTRGWRVAT